MKKKFSILSLLILISCSSPIVSDKSDKQVQQGKKEIISTRSPDIASNQQNINSQPTVSGSSANQSNDNSDTKTIITENQIFLNGQPVIKPTVVSSAVISDSKLTNVTKNDINFPKVTITSSPIEAPVKNEINKIIRGNKIFYSAVENNISQIYSVNKDGSDNRKISNEIKNQFYPAIYQNGSDIFFINTLSDNSNDIYSFDSNGDNVKRITNLAKKINYLAVYDKDKIVYILDGQIYLIDNSVTFQLSKSEEKIISPVWSNINEISFLKLNNGVLGDVFSIDDQGSNLKQITRTGDIKAFDKKDNIIVFSTIEGLVLTDENLQYKKLIYKDGFISQLSLSPDKNYIAFTSSKSNRKEIYVIKTDGNELKKISKDWESFDPTW